MLRRLLVTIGVILIFILGYLVIREMLQKNGITQMKKEELIRTAAEYARQQGWKVEDYSVASVTTEGEAYWIAFQGKSGLVGDHFSVSIDAESGQVIRLVPGR